MQLQLFVSFQIEPYLSIVPPSLVIQVHQGMIFRNNKLIEIWVHC